MARQDRQSNNFGSQQPQGSAGRTSDTAPASPNVRPRVSRQGGTSIRDSFSALKGSSSFRRDLRGKRNELEALRLRIKNDKAIQADNLAILANYDTLMNEQREILAGSKAAKEQAENTKRKLETELRPWEVKLDDMREAHRKALRPLQDDFETAKKNLSDIEAELSGAQREYDSLERQLRRAADQKRSTLELKFSAQKPIVENWQVQKASAVNRKNQAEAVFEGQQSTFSSEERPLEAEIERLKGLISVEKATIDDMSNKVDNATKRIDYGRHVKENPAETERLGASIVQNESYELELTQVVKDLGQAHDKLKSQSLKAKILLVVGIVLLLAIIGVVAFLILRATGVIA